MKQIICPTDFSPEATNAAEYASRLAADMGAKLLFINVQRIIPALAGNVLENESEAGDIKHVQEAFKKLSELCDVARKELGVKADFEVDVTALSLEKILTLSNTLQTLVVMGTNGIDDLNQYFFGTNAFQLVKKANCPVLIVPGGVSYKRIQKIAVAWNYDNREQVSMEALNDFRNIFDPEIVFMHISTHDTAASKDIYNAFCDELRVRFGNGKVTCERVVSDEISPALSQLIRNSKSDFLCLTYHDKGWLKNIFQNRVVKTLAEVSSFPVMVFHFK